MGLNLHSKENKEPEFYKSMLNTTLTNYRVYYLSKGETILYFIALFIVGGVVGLIFYGNLFMSDGEATRATYICNAVVFLVAGVIANKIFKPILAQSKCKKRKTVLGKQFREFLSSMNASIASGSNVAMAIRSACEDMEVQFGADAAITQEVREMKNGMDNNISIYAMMKNFAERSGIEDITDFANVFEICFQKGGDLQHVIRNSYDLMGNKMVIEEEIQTMMTSNKTQQSVMSVVPIGIIAFLRVSSSSFAESFASPVGVLTMTIAIGIFIGSFLYGRKIIDIKG
jgi:tight adherence protein B